jgi:AP-4 complex subunit mu-1
MESVISVSKNKPKNEVYVDVIERVSVLFNNTGFVINSEVEGCVTVKSYLSGAPVLKLGLSSDLVIGRQDDPRSSVVLDD